MFPLRMYVTHSCPFCQQALRFLESHPHPAHSVQIVYVDDDEEAKDEFRSKGFTGVPAFEQGETRWQGFFPARLDQALAQISASPEN